MQFASQIGQTFLLETIVNRRGVCYLVQYLVQYLVRNKFRYVFNQLFLLSVTQVVQLAVTKPYYTVFLLRLFASALLGSLAFE